ncbi:unnamed protein product [Protopolystoma xenopodis]|uniref:Origin recognition complex subunit 1 n=1 Tax=Protopolystoma xenopodis TaxID=117903 RepID=A0A448XFW3_9PLAT|nr:unnamed protein product [Protopolystoma xenopodis]
MYPQQTFKAYSYSPFQDEAIELAARKVAAVSGDARRALDICRRAHEIAKDEGADQNSKKKGPVSMQHIDIALKEMFTTPKVQAICFATSIYEKLFLRAVIAEFKARASEEAFLGNCILQMNALCRMEGALLCPHLSN